MAGSGRSERAFDHVFDLLGAEHGEHDRVAVVGDLSEASRASADFVQDFVTRRVYVMAHDRKPRCQQAAGVDLAHQPETDDADERPLVRAHGSAAMLRSRATASRLSRNAFGTGMPWTRR